MLIDRKHTPWFFVTVVLALASWALYAWDAPRHPTGPGGGTLLGLIFGGAALAIMFFLVALALKRRVPHWRLGTSAGWLRAHIWLGLMTPWFVALHGAFRAGGAMTTALWVVLGLVTLSGIFGLVMQQVVPALLRHSVRHETVAQQLGRELASLITLAEGRTESVGPRIKVVTPGIVLRCVGTSIEHPVPHHTTSETLTPDKVAELIKTHEPIPGAEPIRQFYIDHVRPFLQGESGARLTNLSRSEAMFESVRTSTPAHLHGALDELETLCQRRRELLRQAWLMRVLMIWLFVHAPLSWALLLAAIVHAVIALRY